MTGINRSDIYDKNINFLIGSGASVGLFPTLTLNLKNSITGEAHTLESLAADPDTDDETRALLFSYYIRKVILPAAEFSPYDSSRLPAHKRDVLDNYKRFLSTTLKLLEKKKNVKKANLFTTNYDGLFAHAAESLLREGGADFILNDGGIGFRRRTLQARAFNRYAKDQGVFDRHETYVAQMNLIQLHGSVHWYKLQNNIEISYNKKRAKTRVKEVPLLQDANFDTLIEDSTCTELALKDIETDYTNVDIRNFWSAYQELPIVNPTKWKFHETVFEEQYYQALRLMSYELEKPNAVFIVFGFSFADEHILSLTKRSLSNPTLQVFICCFSDSQKSALEDEFQNFPNVVLLRTEGYLDFSTFNDEIFSVESAAGQDPWHD